MHICKIVPEYNEHEYIKSRGEKKSKQEKLREQAILLNGY